VVGFPAHTIGSTFVSMAPFSGSEIKLQALFTVFARIAAASRSPAPAASNLENLWFSSVIAAQEFRPLPVGIFATTTRVTMVPGKLLVGVFGTTSGRKKFCFPFFARFRTPAPATHSKQRLCCQLNIFGYGRLCGLVPLAAQAGRIRTAPAQKNSQDRRLSEKFRGILHLAGRAEPCPLEDGRTDTGLVSTRTSLW